MKIMVIDDSKDVLILLEKCIRHLGYEPYCYKYPEDAIENIISVQPAIIISDYIMFDMDGMELIQKLKHIYPTGIYILFTSLREQNLINLCAEREIKYLNKDGKCDAVKKTIEEINVNY